MNTVEEITENNFYEKVGNSDTPVLVQFFSSSQPFNEIYFNYVKTFKMDAGSSEHICHMHDIDITPTYMIFNKGWKIAEMNGPNLEAYEVYVWSEKVLNSII